MARAEQKPLGISRLTSVEKVCGTLLIVGLLGLLVSDVLSHKSPLLQGAVVGACLIYMFFRARAGHKEDKDAARARRIKHQEDLMRLGEYEAEQKQRESP